MVKADVVNFAKSKWPLLFSKYYEATQISGPDVGAVNVILAVNSTGICIVTNAERVLLQLTYIEIHSIALLHHQAEKQFQLLTVQGYEFVYQSPSADVITDLVQWVINSLKQISKYFIAIQDYSPPGGGGLLNMKRGDLIALEEGEREGDWLTGYNVLTGDWGEFPGTSVRVLPTILQPPLHIVAHFNKEGALDGTLRAKAIQRIIPMENKHTLEQYCKKSFREPLGLENLWQHSPQPLRLPLHKSLQSHPQKDVAVTGYMGVLKYMGDLPIPAGKQTDITEIIFQGPMEHEVLRDELFCQLMKQLTDNKSLNSEEKGWELMCLATGLFAPSSEVLKELRLFLSSREQPMAYDSLQRLEECLTHGNRKHPPHWTEVQAMQQKVPITHTILFPNFTEQRFEVNSTTRIGDLVQHIGDRLNFQSAEGFCLVVSIRDKTVALANEEFLFDSIQEICSWVASDSSFKKVPQAYQDAVQVEIQRMENLNIIERSKSTYVNAIIPGRTTLLLTLSVVYPHNTCQAMQTTSLSYLFITSREFPTNIYKINSETYLSFNIKTLNYNHL
ncbi:Unconventional myosin-VIIa [Homalodisca vitripennis]|nr:Unconventional myosin-VIIa [Homalodisca vitripennis]